MPGLTKETIHKYAAEAILMAMYYLNYERPHTEPGYAGELPDFEMIATNCKACMARNGHAHDHTDEVHNVVKLIAAGLFLKDKPLLTLRPSDSRPVLNPEYQGWRASITFALALRVLAYCEDYDELTKATTAAVRANPALVRNAAAMFPDFHLQMKTTDGSGSMPSTVH